MMSVYMRRLTWVWVVPILLLTFWLGADGLNADSIWWDEYYSIYDSGGAVFGPLTPAQIWTRVGERNPWHTPGYFIALSGWGRLVGWSAPALRASSLLIGVLAVAWTYRLARDLYAPRAGVYAAGILGASAFFVHYLHELRMYAPFVLFTAFTIWVYLRLADETRKPGAWAWLGLLAGALGMLYTHYFAALPLFAIGVYHLYPGVRLLLYHRQRPSPSVLSPQSWLGVVGVLALAGALFLPWFNILLQGLSKAAGDERLQGGAIGFEETLDKLAYLFSNGSVWGFAVLMALGALPLLMRRRGAWRMWFFALALFGAVLATNAAVPVMLEGRGRYLIGLWALLAIIGGLGLVSLRHWRWGRLVAPLLLLLWMANGVLASVNRTITAQLDGGVEIYPVYQVADGLRTDAQPGDTAVNYLPDGLAAWRFGGVMDYYFWSLGMDFRTLERRYNPGEQEAAHAQVMSTLTDKERVWLAYMPEMRPTALDAFQSALATEYRLCTTRQNRQIELELYARAAVCCWTGDSNAPGLIRFGDGITLTGIEPLPAGVTDALPVVVGWHIGDGVPPNTYSAGFHVTDASGALVAQADYGLLYQRFDCRRTAIDTSALPPGEYVLSVVVYAWETGARLPGTLVASGESADALPLATFTKDE